MKHKTAITNIGVLATAQGSAAKSGQSQGEMLKLSQACILIEGETITEIGSRPLPSSANSDYEIIDAGGKLVTPGLVDAHTHLVFAGWRANELGLKLAGVPYLQILADGGGILSTVRQTREATEEALKEKATLALRDMLSLGTTTCEAKSGYGLDLENELKQLRVVKSLNDTQAVELISTLMAAHAVPLEYAQDRRGYIDLVINQIIPAVAKQGLAVFCDVFCETGVFTTEESKEILLTGQRAGLLSKIHADEIVAIGGSELAGKIKAVSAEHLIAVKESGIEALAKGSVIACLLPATSFYLDQPYAPARAMIGAGIPVAIASDFNPGSCPGYSLQFCMNLACGKYKMRPEEVLNAVTINAAAAICQSSKIGSIEPGKQADLVIWNAPDLDFLCYRFGSNLVSTVIKKGERVISR